MSLTPATGDCLVQILPKTGQETSSKTQLKISGDLLSGSFADKAVLCGKDSALQLSRGFPGAESSWESRLIAPESFQIETKFERSKRTLPPD